MPNGDVVHAVDDLIETAVAALLRRVPERWEEYDADSLTATESKALFMLVAAGMVERRIRFRTRLHNHPVAVEATITATGEYGFAEAIEPVLASMWTEWRDAFRAWRNGEARCEPAPGGLDPGHGQLVARIRHATCSRRAGGHSCESIAAS